MGLAALLALNLVASPALTPSVALAQVVPAQEGEGGGGGGGGSWSTLFAPGNQRLIQAEIGFSGAPRAAYHHPFSDKLSIGAMFAFDYAFFYNTDGTTNPSLVFAAPVRVELLQKGKVVLALRADPGFGFTFPEGPATDLVFDILLNAGVSVGARVIDKLTVGGGVEMPVVIVVGDIDGAVIPILFGPMAEYKITNKIALTADMKFGPWIGAGDLNPPGPVSNVDFALKFMVGAGFAI